MSGHHAHLSDAWRKTFPDTDVGAALRFMHDKWNEMVRLYPAAIDAEKCKEPEITQNLGQHLATEGELSALSGIFDYEQPRAQTDKTTGKRINSLRTDITYTDSAHRSASGRRLRLIFEFKKLRSDSDSRNQYIGDSGMMRFISGKYSVHAEHMAYMVGLVHAEPTKSVSGLTTRLKADSIRSRLHIVPDDHGQYLREPPTWCVQSVEFETLHSRTTYGDHGDLTIGHIFLQH
jgi:hypothetical protein